MTLEQQVVSLELAQKLKELGVKQESYFWWSYWQAHSPAENTDCHELHWQVTDENGGAIAPRISAFTVAELGEMLPRKFATEHYNNGDWYCYRNDSLHNHSEYADTEADARAKMLVYLLENKLITL